jgi:hypothetical protein
MLALALMSCWPRFTTAAQPCLSFTSQPSSTSRASVPGSMMSSFVSTPAYVFDILSKIAGYFVVVLLTGESCPG